MENLARVCAAILVSIVAGHAIAQTPGRTQAAPSIVAAEPIVQPARLEKISAHVWVIPDIAQLGSNIGFVVGSKATLVIDTGMGPRNGAIVLQQAQTLSGGKPLYLVTTHVHPEHDLGAQAFPASAKFVRAEKQVQDIEQNGMTLTDAFRARSPLNAELLKDARFRLADVTFDAEYDLDLGGVKVQLVAMGLNHTLGDTVAFVMGDRVLFSGDLAMSTAPAVNAKASIIHWRATLHALSAFKPRVIVPSHGPVGDGQFINNYQTYFAEIQQRAADLHHEGKTADQTVAVISAAMSDRLPNAPARLGAAIRSAYAEAPGDPRVTP